MLKNLRPPRVYNFRQLVWEGSFENDKKRSILVYWNLNGGIEVDIFEDGDRIPQASTVVEGAWLPCDDRYSKKLNREVRKSFLACKDIGNADVLPAIPFADRVMFGNDARKAALEKIRGMTLEVIPMIVADFEDRFADINTLVKNLGEATALLESRDHPALATPATTNAEKDELIDILRTTIENQRDTIKTLKELIEENTKRHNRWVE